MDSPLTDLGVNGKIERFDRNQADNIINSLLIGVQGNTQRPDGSFEI